MRYVRAVALTVALALAMLGSSPANADVSMVPSSDPVMTAAIAKARGSLPKFFARLAKPEKGDERFAVKIYYQTKTNDGEHIWASEVSVTGDQVKATIDNDPRDLPTLKRGQRVAVPKSRITDWMYVKAGRIEGGETIRAILPRLPKEQAEKYRAMLAPQ